jgi:CobQ/CobB/MinD/ParA nucleotide binding domain/CHAT domain
MIYTFYSFKGGVGRSMALANIAELFYRRGLKVLMVDFDLEAPGLERYFNVSNAQFTTTEILGKRGVIDLLVSYKQMRVLPKMVQNNVVNQDSLEEANRLVVEPLEDFCVPIYEKSQNGGELFLLPAGRRSGDYFKKYADNLQSFNWQDFYVNWEGEKFFEWFRESVDSFADVVLIDSRTGITEMGGICTHQLADVVVMFVAANQQNLDGTLKMATSLSNSDLINDGRKGRELFLLPVPSRIDGFEAESLDEFAKLFKNSLSKFIPKNLRFEDNLFADLKIPYLPYYSYQERVAVREVDRDSATDLVKVFEKITYLLVSLSPKNSYLNKKMSLCLTESVGNHFNRGSFASKTVVKSESKNLIDKFARTVLFIDSNPKDIGNLQLDQELRDITEGLKQSHSQFNFVQRWSPRPRDIQRAMLEVSPQIIHFAGHGHGGDKAGLVFEDEVGNFKLVNGTALGALFELFADRVECVLLNACYSVVQANAISQYIPYVIGISQEIGDRAAIAFSVSFYDALSAGRDIEFAFKLGCASIRMEGFDKTPVLLKKPNSEKLDTPLSMGINS